MILSVENLTVRFGGLTALDEFEMQVEEGEIHGIIGPNGAGKTTLLNTISGIYAPTEGSIVFCGGEVGNKRADTIARLGLARTFQNTELFGGMTALENVLVALDTRRESSHTASVLTLPGAWREEKLLRIRAAELLEYVGLHSSGRMAGSLAFGQRRLLEIARAIASEPKLLLLDEPAAGMNEDEIEHIDGLLRSLRDDAGTTILIVEHVMELVMGVCDSITVASEGKKLTAGSPDDVRKRRDVIEAYLGEAHEPSRG